jgi:Fis family transcriptional regulator
MSVVETFGAPVAAPAEASIIEPSVIADIPSRVEPPSLRDNVTNTMEKYFNDMAGHVVNNVYDIALAQVETPLLSAMMRFTRGNQSRAAILLGLSRGTLRKKLKIYDLENIHVTKSNLDRSSDAPRSLSTTIEITVEDYLVKMKGQTIADVYEMVLSEVEEPLLMAMMKYTRGNQSRAAVLFGLSRGTLRKKLKKYGLD